MRASQVAITLSLFFAATPVGAEHARRIENPFMTTHVGTWRGDYVEWRSHFHVPELGDPYRVLFVRPLATGARVEADLKVGNGAVRVSPVLDAEGRIAGVDVAGGWGEAVITTSTPRRGPIEPPLVDGIQRLEIIGARLNPTPPSPLESRLAQIRHRSISYEDVRMFRGVRGVAKTQAIYLLPDDDFYASGGLTPYATPDAEAQERNFVLGASILGLTLLLLGAGARRAAVHARGEAADAYLARVDPDLARDLGEG